MVKLNLPEYPFKIKTTGRSSQIFDTIRKKYVALTPEEWVRQNFISFLIHEKKFPKSLIAIEMAIKINQMQKRGDIVVYDKDRNPLVMVECKAPSVNVTQKVFDQIARYNLVLNVKYLIVTNGLNHYCCMMNHRTQSYIFLEEIPNYKDF